MKLALLLAFAFLALVRAQYLEAKADDTSSGIHGTSRITRRDECGFSGNPDIYGLGIRIGYYTQALSVWIANFFVLNESKKLRSVNTLFMFALFIGLIWISHDPSQTYAIEAFLLVQLLSATWYVGILNKSKFSNRNWKFSPLRMVIQDLTLLGILAYSIWFWWIGLDHMQKTPCGTYIFFLSKVSLYGWYREGFKVLSVIAVSFNLIILSGHVAQLVQYRFTSYTRSPQYFRSLRKNLKLQCERKDLSIGQREKSQTDYATLSPAQELLAASTNHATSYPKSIDNADRTKNLEMLTTSPCQSTGTAGAENSQGSEEPIISTQSTAENSDLRTRISEGVTSYDSAGQESNTDRTKIQKRTSAYKKYTPIMSKSAISRSSLGSTPSPCDSQSSEPCPQSGSGNVNPGALATVSSSREPIQSLSPEAVLHDRTNANVSTLPQAGALSTPPLASQVAENLVERDPETLDPSTTALSFTDVLAADVYLDSILEDSVAVDSMRTYRIPHTRIKILVPSIAHFRRLKFKGHNHGFRLNVIIPLLIHIYYLRTYTFPLYPTLLSRALNHPYHAKISPNILATTIILRRTRLSDHTPPYYYLPSAFCTLTVCVGLVLAIELSLFWNGVTGVTNMGQVGQLVPFVVGIGGLVKVLWVWWKGGDKEEEGEGALEREVRLCAEVYEGMKGNGIWKDDSV